MQHMEAHVLTCLVGDCSFNCEHECCAPKVEVGDEHPMCDMYTTEKVSASSGEPKVSQCKVMRCHFNSGNECGASGVTMTRHHGHADCATFRA